MDTGFKDNLKIPKEKDAKNPWNFDAPSYDQRTSCFVDAGINYGVGHTNPIGKTGPIKNSGVIPTGRVNTLKSDHVHRGSISQLNINEND